ncbi:MAG: tetratricopeptide repeat protein [Chloroflexota bacterium]
MNLRKNLRNLSLSLAALVGITAVIVGMLLASGSTLPKRVFDRIEREITARQPRPQFLPTPLPISDLPINDNLSAHGGANDALAKDSLGILAAQPAATLPIDTAQIDTPTSNPQISLTANISESIATNPVVESPTPPTVAELQSTTSAIFATSTPIRIPTAISSHPSTPIPSPTSTLVPLPTPSPTQAYLPAKPAIELTGLIHQWQTWNNCGPATLSINLSFFGSTLDQADVAAVLRQYEDDKNVNPAEMVAFARSQGYEAHMRINGSSQLIKTLLTNQIPVLIETWLEEEPNDGMGHYRLLTGYNDIEQNWIAYDSYVSHDLIAPDGPYQGVRLDYAETDALWHVFNRTYLLIVPPDKLTMVEDILGEEWETKKMWQEALRANQVAITQNSNDPYAWFNLGSSLTEVGEYGQATQAYDQARRLGLPWRMLWYQFGPFKAYYQVKRYDEVLALAYATLATTDSIEEIHYWKGKALAATGNPQSAEEAWQEAIKLNPNYQDAMDALAGR